MGVLKTAKPLVRNQLLAAVNKLLCLTCSNTLRISTTAHKTSNTPVVCCWLSVWKQYIEAYS